MPEAKTHIEAMPEAVYGLISDITRMGEWSPENIGGEWLDGADRPAVGAKFKGKNKRKLPWTTTAVVTAAEPGREFAFAIGRNAPEAPDTTWRYQLEPAGGGTDITESFEIVQELGPIGRFFTKLGTGVTWEERPADMVKGMETTLENLKAAAKS